MTIDLWSWRLSADDAEIERLAALLSPDEQARAARFVFDRHRSRFTAARGRLREILGGIVDRVPEDLRFAYGEHGKPSLAGMPDAPYFNLSHSNEVALLAVGPRDLGADVEFIRPLKEDVAGRFFSAGEIAALSALTPEDALAGFYQCWTRKEAVIKALGTGLSLPLQSFDVSVGNGEARLLRLAGAPGASRTWFLTHIEPAPGYVGAIACDAGGLKPKIRICASVSDSAA